jgi:hypothetical protein
VVAKGQSPEIQRATSRSVRTSSPALWQANWPATHCDKRVDLDEAHHQSEDYLSWLRMQRVQLVCFRCHDEIVTV